MKKKRAFICKSQKYINYKKYYSTILIKFRSLSPKSVLSIVRKEKLYELNIIVKIPGEISQINLFKETQTD